MQANYAKQATLFIVLLIYMTGCHSSTAPAPETPLPQSSTAVLKPDEPDESAPVIKEPTAEEKAESAQYRQLGLEYRGQGRYEDAITALQNSVRLDPQNLSGQVILGWTLHLANQPDNAIAVLQQTVIQSDNHVPALNALGIVYLVDGQLEKAVETHTKAVTLQPDNEIGYYNLSLAYHRLEDYENAIANAQQAADLEPGNPHPFVALAIAHWDNQEPIAAQQAYQQAINLDPSYQEAWFLDHLQQAGFSSEQIQKTDDVRQSL
jgi:tetratricopeptide (TPR) repeat protein